MERLRAEDPRVFVDAASGGVTRIDITEAEGVSTSCPGPGRGPDDVPPQVILRRDGDLRRGRMLAAVEQVSATGWWQADGDLRPAVCSQTLFRLLGLSPADPVPTAADLLAMVVPRDRRVLLDAVTSARRDGVEWDCVVRVNARDGSERVLRLVGDAERPSAFTPGSRSKRSSWIWCVVGDVTALREAERGHRQSRELLDRVLDAATDECVIVTDRNGRITTFSAGAERMLGYTAEEMIGTSHERLHDPEEVARAVAEYGVETGPQAMAAITRAGAGATRRWAFVTRSGDRRRVALSVTTVLDEEGNPLSYVGVGTDLTRQVRAERALRASEERFRLAFDGAPIGMAMLDATPPIDDCRFFRVNNALCRLVGRAESELIGSPVDAIAHPDDIADTRQALTRLVEGSSASVQAEKRYRHADGRDIWVRVSTSLVRDESDGGPRYFVMQVEDVTARKEAEQELSHRALHDGLTGLPNRMLLLDHLAGALARAERQRTHVAVMFLDLDHFKDVNDSLGHDAGDALLVDIAQRLRRCLRETDTAARLGGDEFVVVCEGLSAPEEAAISASRIERALKTQIPQGARTITVTVSVGVATSRGHSTPGDLLRDADAAMYRAKERGRARYEIADPALQASALRRLTLESELRRAVSARQLELHYQPAYDLRTGNVTAIEAQLRWRHPSRGLLTPRHFLDVAEDQGLIDELSDWVLATACRQARSWQAREGRPAPALWVNVSARQLGRKGLSRRVEESLVASGLDPDALWLELPERQLLSLAGSVHEGLHALSALGVHLAVDGVGTGLVGVDYVRHIPVGMLKLDPGVVGGLGRSRTDSAIARSVIALGHALDVRVAAEGVETSAQHEELRTMHCDVAQGAGLHPPAAAPVIDALLAG